MTDKTETKRLIGEVLAEIIDEAKSGCGKQTTVGLMAYGSELGSDELAKGAVLAMENDPSVKVRPIGPKVAGYEHLDWIETAADEHESPTQWKRLSATAQSPELWLSTTPSPLV